MPHIKLLVEMGLPSPESAEKKPKGLSLEEKVRHALELIDSGYKSDTEWIMINKLYRDLMARKDKSPRVQNLIRMIEPVLKKFGYHGVSSED